MTNPSIEPKRRTTWLVILAIIVAIAVVYLLTHANARPANSQLPTTGVAR